MRIAIASQNWRTITPHAGRTRRFYVYSAEPGGEPHLEEHLELPKDQTLHDWGNQPGHPIFEYDVIIAASMGARFIERMAHYGVEAIVTNETDPETAAQKYINGTLPTLDPECHEHGHEH